MRAFPIAVACMIAILGSSCEPQSDDSPPAPSPTPTIVTPTDLVSPSEVLLGKEYFDDTGTLRTGTMLHHGSSWDLTTPFLGAGYYAGISADISSMNVCVGTNILGSPGLAVCTSHNYGIWDLTDSFPGVGSYAGVSHVPASNIICLGSTIVGVGGAAVCQVGSTSNGAITLNVLAGKEYWNSAGVKQIGTMVDRGGSWDIATAFPGNGYYSGVVSTLGTNDVCFGKHVLGQHGTAICSTVDYGVWNLTAAFPGVGHYSGVSNVPVSSTICTGTSIVGVGGSAVCQIGSTSSPVSVSNVLLGKEYWDSTGTKQIGTMVNRGNGWDLTTAFPGNGFYSGVSSAVPAAKVCSGTQFLGHPGTALCLAGSLSSPAVAADVLLDKEFFDGSGTKVTGTMPDHETWDMREAFPGAGRYAAVSHAPAASDVCAGVAFNGSDGMARCITSTSSNPAGAANILDSFEAWDTNGSKMVGSMPNRGALDASAAFTGDGYYSGVVNNAPIASKICTGTTVLGVAGSANCGVTALHYGSNAYRDSYAAQITQYAETSAYMGAGLPAGYRDIPDISRDDDGYSGSSVVKAARPTVDCGTSHATMALRIDDCSAKNAAAAIWDGSIYGNAGQGLWRLVARNGLNNEVWRDERTGLLWSSRVSAGINWCKASGNSGPDSSGICTNASHQSAALPESVCAETSGSTHVNASQKGGLKLASAPAVRWRLPTIYDYQQANIHGIRFVMPDMSGIEWSASAYSDDRSRAWHFHGGRGDISHEDRTLVASVRCVGR